MVSAVSQGQCLLQLEQAAARLIQIAHELEGLHCATGMLAADVLMEATALALALVASERRNSAPVGASEQSRSDIGPLPHGTSL